MTHGTADIEPGLRLHYVLAGASARAGAAAGVDAGADAGAGARVGAGVGASEGAGEGHGHAEDTDARTIVLLHGFPQTWWEWRHVIAPLADAGFRIVAPDYRGAGHSWRPLAGYDKRTMAEDVHRLLREHLRLEGPIALVGHDIGLMVAYAYAQAHRDEVSHLVVMDAPLPGTSVFDRLRADPRVWHFAFHGARDVPEMLVAGRERPYLQAFYDARCFDPSAIDEADLDIYASAYAAPGAMRAGFELYRAFDQDARDNRDAFARNGPLPMPVLAVGGETSTSGPLVEAMMREVARDVTGVRIAGTAHWIAEENPDAFTTTLLRFLTPTSVDGR